MRYLLLGPVEVHRDDGLVPINAGRLRALLAVLVLNRNRVVATDSIIDLLWRGAEPASARITVQNYVMRLRRILGGGHEAALLTKSPGYVLAVEPGECDVDIFADLTAQAHLALNMHDAPTAARLANEALALWRGPAVADIDIDLTAYTSGLEESRLSTLELRIAADLAQGRHDVVIPELAALVKAYPLRERLWESQMVALHAAGRRADALAAYHEARRTLQNELGLEPSTSLRNMQAAILDGTLQATADTPTRVAEHSSVPAQLPPDLADFTGRVDEIREIRDGITDDSRTSTAIGLVTGPGGVGKTALVVHVAHLLRERFPDGQLFVNLRGTSDRSLTIGDALGRILRDLGLEAARIPETDEERAARYRSLVADKHILLVLDDASTAAQVRPLIPASSDCAVLVTSRYRLAGLVGCRRVNLTVLDPQAARDLFCSIVGDSRGGAEATAVTDIIQTCGYLPLAVRIAASRLAVRSGWRIEALRDRLADTHRRLDELHVDDLHVRTCFQLSYHTLSPDQAHAFRLLSILDSDDVSATAAAKLLGVDRLTAERLAEALVDVHLLEAVESGRYRFHDLLRLFAREEATNVESPADLGSALSRLLDEYADVTCAVAQLARPGYLADERKQDMFPDAASAHAWLETERSAIVTTLIQATETGRADATTEARILHNIQWYLRAGGRWDLWERCATAVLNAALRTRDRGAELVGRQQLGLWAALRGREDEATAHLTVALRLSRALGDRHAEGDVLNRLGLAVYTANRFGDAIDFHERALDVFLELDDPRGECIARINLGKCHRDMGQPGAALHFLVPALEIARKLDDHFNVTIVLHHMACCQSDSGRHRDAIEAHTACLTEVRRAGYFEGEAYTLAELGRAHAALGELTQALEHLRSALGLFRKLGDPRAAATFLVDVGQVLVRMGDRQGADRAWREALAVFESCDPVITAELHASLAALHDPSLDGR